MSSNSAQLSGQVYENLPSAKFDKYQDMLNLARPEIPGHPRMSRASRAAQFMPFAALTGYDELVAETEEHNIYTGNIIIADDEQLEFASAEIMDEFPEEGIDEEWGETGLT